MNVPWPIKLVSVDVPAHRRTILFNNTGQANVIHLPDLVFFIEVFADYKYTLRVGHPWASRARKRRGDRGIYPVALPNQFWGLNVCLGALAPPFGPNPEHATKEIISHFWNSYFARPSEYGKEFRLAYKKLQNGTFERVERLKLFGTGQNKEELVEYLDTSRAFKKVTVEEWQNYTCLSMR